MLAKKVILHQESWVVLEGHSWPAAALLIALPIHVIHGWLLFNLASAPLFIIKYLLKCLAVLGLWVNKIQFDKQFSCKHTPLQHYIDTTMLVDSGTAIPVCLSVPTHLCTYPVSLRVISDTHGWNLILTCDTHGWNLILIAVAKSLQC